MNSFAEHTGNSCVCYSAVVLPCFALESLLRISILSTISQSTFFLEI